MTDPPITLGLWPIAGITTVGVTESDALATIKTAIDCGITRFDTAYSYGYDGESDRLLGRCISQSRDSFHVMSKVGQHWDHHRKRIVDGSPATLSSNAKTSLRRIGIDCFDCLMLHCPDPKVPIEQSAEAFAILRESGICKSVGVCNATRAQRQAFASVAGCDAIQCPLNILQSGCLDEIVPECQADSCEVFVYWTLMKGLLAGKIARDHVFADGDVRPSYDIFQGSHRELAHQVIDRLTTLGLELGLTVGQLSIGWAISQHGITGAIIGARRPNQIRETAGTGRLDQDVCDRIVEIVVEARAATPKQS